jgi:2-methylisocitrate lyase-like PEP mutase family enzyme
MAIISLRSRFLQPGAVLAPGAYDALSALLIEQAGFEAVYLSGASIAYTQLGRPDVGLVTASQVADVVARVRDRVEIPIIADIDTGFGNAINVKQTVRQFERLGASALQIEDQTAPKRCGHLQGKELIPTAEMVGKVKAAIDARKSAETLIIARTDALAVEGLGHALDRARAYLDAGADVPFIEAPQTLEQMKEICAAFAGRAPLLANMVEGGKTPILTKTQLEELGFKLVIAPGSLVRAFAHMSQQFLHMLQANGTTTLYRDRMLDFAAINDLLGLPKLLTEGQEYGGAPRKAAE